MLGLIFLVCLAQLKRLNVRLRAAVVIQRWWSRVQRRRKTGRRHGPGGPPDPQPRSKRESNVGQSWRLKLRGVLLGYITRRLMRSRAVAALVNQIKDTEQQLVDMDSSGSDAALPVSMRPQLQSQLKSLKNQLSRALHPDTRLPLRKPTKPTSAAARNIKSASKSPEKPGVRNNRAATKKTAAKRSRPQVKKKKPAVIVQSPDAAESGVEDSATAATDPAGKGVC